MVENVPNLMKNTIPQTQEAQSIPSRIHIKKTTARPITAKLLKTKDKEKIFKSAKE